LQEKNTIENGINAAKYQNLTSCSKATATRELQDLFARRIMKPI